MAALYKSRISWWVVLLLVVAAATAIVVALLVSDVGGVYADLSGSGGTSSSTGSGAVRMISMRYHIVSLAAVFLALALGIVLGATKISSPLLSGLQGDNAEL